MSKKLENRLKLVVRQNSCLEIYNNNILRCKVCSVTVKYDVGHLASRVKDHINSKSHQEFLKEGKKQPFIDASISLMQQSADRELLIKKQLTRAMIEADIPFQKLEVLAFRKLLEDCIGFKLPSKNTFRSCVKETYEETLDMIRGIVADKDVCFVMDETTDRMERFQVNIMVSVLDGNPSRAMLFYVDFIDFTNSSEMLKLFMRCCRLLWNKVPIDEDPPYHRVKMVVTDQASYMLKALDSIKILSPSVIHLTCLAHCLSRVCESIRDLYPRVDVFLASLKETFRNSRKRKVLYQKITELALPPKVVVTRWGTWLEGVRYVVQNRKKMVQFFDTIESKAGCVTKVKKLLVSQLFHDDVLVLSDYLFLIDAIKRLESRSLRLNDCLDIIRDVKSKLESLKLVEPKKKLNSSLSKNPGYNELVNLKDFELRISLKYAPGVSVEVERSFSQTKNILDQDRCRFKPETLKMYYVVSLNNFLFNNNIQEIIDI